MADYVSSYTGAQIDSAIEWVNENKNFALFSETSSAPTFLDEEYSLAHTLENLAKASALGRVRLIQDDNGGGVLVKNGTDIYGIGVIAGDLFYGTLYNLDFDSDADAIIERELYEQGTMVRPSLYALTSLSNASLTKSFGTSGYYKAPDGMMFAWGTSSNQISSFNVYFSASFAYVPYCIVTTSKQFGTNAVECAAATPTSPSYFRMYPYYVQVNASNNVGKGPSGNNFMWLAIGRWK